MVETLEGRTFLSGTAATLASSAAGSATGIALLAPTTDPRGGFEAIKLRARAPLARGSVDVNNLLVTGPGGPLTVVSARAQKVDSSYPQVPWEPQVLAPVNPVPGVVYTVQPPGGSWDPSDDGTYTVTLRTAAVRLAAGGAVRADPLQFQVAVGGGPTVRVDVQDVTAGDAAPLPISVTIHDEVGVDAASVDAGDVSVTGPADPLAVELAGTITNFDGRSALATYQVAPPGGSWDAADNGTYTVSIPAGAVQGSEMKPVAPLTRQFRVAVDVPPPTTGPDLAVEILEDPMLPAAAVNGGSFRAAMRVANQGDVPAAGRVAVRFLARPIGPHADPLPQPGPDVELTPGAARPLRLRPGQGRVVNARLRYPDSLADGYYQLVAQVDPANVVAEADESNNEVSTFGGIQITAPFTQLSVLESAGPVGGSIRVGRKTAIPVTVRNMGNQVVGAANFDVFARPAGGMTAQTVRLGTGTIHKRLRLQPGERRAVRLSVRTDEALPPGQYDVIVSVNVPPASSTGPADIVNGQFIGTFPAA